MTKKEINKEYEKLTYELFVNRPDIAPYPPDVVKRREYLLFAEVHLGNIMGAKMKKDKWEEEFETEMYKKVMKIYCNWDIDEK